MYTCKNSAETRSATAPIAGQGRQQNVVKGKPGPTAYSKQRVRDDDPLESYHVFFDEGMFDLLVRYTNIEGNRVKDNWIDMDRVEMMAFVGLVILRGV